MRTQRLGWRVVGGLTSRPLLMALASVVIAVSIFCASRPVSAQSRDIARLNQRVLELTNAGKIDEAIPLVKRIVELTRASKGRDRPETAAYMSLLADFYVMQGKSAEAEPLYTRSLGILEKALDADDTNVVSTRDGLAALYQSQGRYANAGVLYERGLAVREKRLGPNHPDVLDPLKNLAGLYVAQGRYADAEPLYKRSLALAEKSLGADHLDVRTLVNELGVLYQIQSRYAEAEPLFQRSLAISEKTLGPDDPSVGTALNNLAALYNSEGRFEAAEPLFLRGLELQERTLGREHPSVGTSLNNLAQHYMSEGRPAEAELLFQRARIIFEKAQGLESPDVAIVLGSLAGLYKNQQRFAEAESLYLRASAILEKAYGADNRQLGGTLNDLATLYLSQGRIKEAESTFKRDLAISEKALGVDDQSVTARLTNLAALYMRDGRYADAEPLLKRTLRIREKVLGTDHPYVGLALDNLSSLYFEQRNWALAADYGRQSTALAVRATRRRTAFVGAPSGKGKTQTQQNSGQFSDLVKVVYRLASTQPATSAALTAETFAASQWAHSTEAASALAQMAARGAVGADKPGLSQMVREREDLLTEWQSRDQTRVSALSQPAGTRDAKADAANVEKLAAIDSRIAAIDARLKVDFPGYAALASTEPSTIEQVQTDLRKNEALILFLDTTELKPAPEETFIWVVTKTDVRWVRSELGTSALAREVAALRCGLDYAGAWLTKGSRCKDLTGGDYTPADNRDHKPLPFDSVRAHTLYTALFGQVGDLIKGMHLLIVPSGPLTQLPLQVLVTAEPAAGSSTALRDVAWFARSNAITMLPAVSSLKALRQNARESAAAEPFVGFGNPVLTGGPRCEKIDVPEECPADELKPSGATQLTGSAAVTDRVPSYFRNGLANVAAVRKLCPLPETAHELNCVAKSLGAAPGSIILGGDMTESALKKMPLNRYRVIHFATHGLLAGESAKLSAARAEPALVMSPPDNPTEEDDGLLTASEVTGLKLDADWVVMSACNTAGGDEQGAEALSGLARAFFYAGARALMVSHWAVESYAATMLTSRTFSEMRNDKTIGRSEALRRAMLALMSDPDRPWAAEPSVWAPFFVVGEGGTNSSD